MAYRNRRRDSGSRGTGSPARRAAGTGLILSVVLFLLPLLTVPSPGSEAAAEELPTGTLPIHRAVQTASGERDKNRMVKLQQADGTVAELSMSDYLFGVVAAEMPAAFEEEALKAQACAARTYTVGKQGRTTQAHPEADVCTDINCCQAYIEPDQAAENWGENAQVYTAKIAAAVADTDGVAALYDGAPIQAVFFSSAAGRTVDAVEVWGNAVPYLSGVDSPEGEEVPNYHSTASVPVEEFKRTLLAKVPQADLSGPPSGWFGDTVRNSAGGVSSVTVGGAAVTGSALRELFSLRSANFTVTADESAVTFSVTGYGHGVGMSQYGANALARQGKTYEEILKWYYTGIELGRYSPAG